MTALRKISLVFSALLIVSGLLVWFAVHNSYTTHALLPKPQSHYPWRAWANAGAHQGQSASIDLRESTYSLSADFTLGSGAQYPYANLGLTFDDEENPNRLIDLSMYQSVVFRIKCRPANVLTFSLYTYVDKITRIPDITSYRLSETFLSCHPEWRDVRINLQALSTPGWWLGQHQMNLADQDYRLDQARGFSIISSPESPLDTPSSIIIESIVFAGRDYFWVYLIAGLAVLLWAGFAYWAIPYWAAQRPARTETNALISYQPVTAEPKHEREKAVVLAYLAREYSNAEVSVESAVKATGVNRTKINNILRDETGLTFTGYLNKIRLTEAARLLADERMGVAEAAFAVGYSSLSYFNRVFKKAYGCPPSTYKKPADTADPS